jgi:hAT family C-terminal dimerisation region
LNPLQHCLTPE